MGPVIPELFEREQRLYKRESFSPKERKAVPVHASTWKALLSYGQESDAILAFCFVGFMTYFVKIWPDGSGVDFNTANWIALGWTLLIGGAAYLVYVPLALWLTIAGERKAWNNGVCAETGRAWQGQGRELFGKGLKFTSPSDSLVRIAGFVWPVNTLRCEYFHTLVLEYIAPAD